MPNILFAIADDWGWPHAGAYGDPVVKTPSFDRLAREGVLFHHAYVSSPSCTPSRGAILTGQWHWRLKGAGNLWSVFPDQFVGYPELLEPNGYVTGHQGKAWGPGRPETVGSKPGRQTLSGLQTISGSASHWQTVLFLARYQRPASALRAGFGKGQWNGPEQDQAAGLFPRAPRRSQ